MGTSREGLFNEIKSIYSRTWESIYKEIIDTGQIKDSNTEHKPKSSILKHYSYSSSILEGLLSSLSSSWINKEKVYIEVTKPGDRNFKYTALLLAIKINTNNIRFITDSRLFDISIPIPEKLNTLRLVRWHKSNGIFAHPSSYYGIVFDLYSAHNNSKVNNKFNIYRFSLLHYYSYHRKSL